MTDIISSDSDGLGLYDTQTVRAANILAVQLGHLEYAQELGIDLKFFLSEDFSFQNESFKAYLIQVLANQGINVSSVLDVLESLQANYTFKLVPDTTSTGLIAR